MPKLRDWVEEKAYLTVAVSASYVAGAVYRISKRLDPDDSRWGLRDFGGYMLATLFRRSARRHNRPDGD